MSATATTTLSDTLVVGRQPQQSVGIRSVSPFFSPTTSSLRISGPSSPSPIPTATRESIGLDPQFTPANRPGGVRFLPRPRINKHTHHHPTQTTTSRGMRPACCGFFRTGAPSWSGTRCCASCLCVTCGSGDRFFDSSSQGASFRVGRGEAEGKIIALTNEAYPSPPTTTGLLRPLSLIDPFAWAFSNSHTDRNDFQMVRITIMFMAIHHLNLTLPIITRITRTTIIPITVTITPLPTLIPTPTHI